jgi:hypothetical protein
MYQVSHLVRQKMEKGLGVRLVLAQAEAEPVTSIVLKVAWPASIVLAQSQIK